MMEKVINGIRVELVKGADCRSCVFHETRKGVKYCNSTDNSCLDIYRGGWRRVEEPKELINEDPLY